MNEYSYHHGWPQYQQQQPQTASTSEANGPYYNSSQANAGPVQGSYEYNQAVIPGLAFGFSAPNQQAPGQHASFPSYPSQLPMSAPVDGLSEGELEDDDIYEPMADNDGRPSDVQLAPQVEPERAASYSPEFSAGEVDESNDIDMHQTSTSFASRSEVTMPKHSETAVTATEQVIKAREEARAALSSLRFLGLPRQIYLDHHIDRAVLEDLFGELGLSFPPPTSVPVGDVATRDTTAKPAAATNATATAKPVAKADSKAPESKPSSPKDSAESRKDRIARLLAAKNSRQASVSQTAASTNDENNQVGVSASAPASSLPNKPNAKSLEKSKLLQQKMEALRKAREAKVNSSSAQPETIAQQPVQPPKVDVTETSASTPVPQSELPVVSGPSASANVVAPRGNASKRPVASDFDTPSYASSKRSYGQTYDARQYLIHVSDDEEESDGDTEMDIETPEERSQSFAPAIDSALLRNHPQLSDSPHRGPNSPANTPARPKSIIGAENLSKMYDRIEEMKRRIEKAEASKQAKSSRSGTPLDTPGKSGTEIESRAAATVEDVASRASPASSAAGSTFREPTAPTQAASSPQARPSARRSLSRSAQERLTSIESERKNKELKMRIMRAKIAQMEREMAASLQEEEALYERGDDEVLDDDMSESAAIDVEDSSVTQTPIAAAESESEALAVKENDSNISPPVSAEAAGVPELEPEVKNDTHEDLKVSEEEGVLPGPAHQSAEEAANVSDDDDDDDAEMKDVTDNESSDSESENGEASDSDELSNSADATEPITKNFDNKIQDDAQGQSESDSSGESADEQTDSDQDSSEGGISGEVDSNNCPRRQEHADKVQLEPDSERSEVLSQRADDSNQSSEAGVAGEDRNESDRPSVAGQLPDIDELMGLEPPKHVDQPSANAAEAVAGFRPYESPLSYFHAYRFHPEFQRAVKGGLRSLTYSNKIDVQKPMCPDELAGGECPRGPRCNFQHLGKISTPDDQILMQLGSYGAREGDEQERFNNGLRKLLQELKSRESQDFAAISQAIIDYRAQFHGDKSKILPLGNIHL